MRSLISRNLSALLAVGLAIALGGCGKQNPRTMGPVAQDWGRMEGLETIVGNMSDTSYSMSRNLKRPNAKGEDVSIGSIEGFIWVEYAAPWCAPCAGQAAVTKQVEAESTLPVTFITIMTSASETYDDHATVATAKAWASAHNLDPGKVLAAELWAKTIPEHRFYSPDGHTLFVHVGTLTAQQMKDVIQFYSQGYDTWKTSKTLSEWMTE